VLLLDIAQTRVGATAVVNAGLFHSVQASGLFAMDPDLGVGKWLYFNRSFSLSDSVADHPRSLKDYLYGLPPSSNDRNRNPSVCLPL
jgi:hypothetical protein